MASRQCPGCSHWDPSKASCCTRTAHLPSCNGCNQHSPHHKTGAAKLSGLACSVFRSKGETFSRTSAIKPAMLLRYIQHHNLWEVSHSENRLWRCSGFRSELETFRKMGAIKPELVLRYMQQYKL